jgi:hypothetical protein
MNPHRNPSPRALGRAAYHKISHLPGSRLGPSDRCLSAQQAARCLSSGRPGDRVIVQEKLDGSCVAAWRDGDRVLALGRDGRLAATSPFIGRRQWAAFVTAHHARFLALLCDGERVVGEWLTIAHGTRYTLPHAPFVAFDLLRGDDHTPWDVFSSRAAAHGFTTPALLHAGGPLSIADALTALGPHGHHGALDPPEGAVWRVERGPRVCFLAKFVLPNKTDGALLPEHTGADYVLNAYPPDPSP